LHKNIAGKLAAMANKLYTLFSFLFIASTSFAQNVVLKGKVYDEKTKEPLAGAYVHFAHQNGGALTDAFGQFSITKIAAGSYEVKVKYVGYEEFEQEVVLSGNKAVEVNIALKEKAQSLQEAKVYGRASPETEASSRRSEKNAANITNVLSAQAMQRSPDINAANVLQRMSGLTIQRNGGGDEAYPIIRGLDPRYNNTLINGIKITSPDDKSRYVPLNIVPSDLLGSIEVHKSLLPEMEGDAIGGSVNMVMKDAPEKEIFSVLGSLGYNKIFIDRKFVNFSRKDIQQKSVIEKYGSSYTAQPDDFSRSNLDFSETRPMPNTVAGFVYGRRFLHRKLGLLVAENFQEQYYGSNSVFNKAAPDVHAGGAPTISDYANRSFSTRQLNEGLTLHLDYALNDRNKITLTSITLYSALSQARIITDTSILGGNGGRTVQGTGPVSTDYTSITSRQFLQNLKLEGKHILSKHFLVDWAGVFSYAAKRSPDMADLSIRLQN